jgi:biopolymer transport protein ExbD
MNKGRNRISAKADINITPLIDILLVLLVIFMTISPQVPKALDTAIPQPSPPDRVAPPNPPELIIVSVEKEGVIKINQGETVDLASLGARLKAIFAPRPDHTMFITADPELRFEDVVKVIDVAKGPGTAEKIGLMTQRQPR